MEKPVDPITNEPLPFKNVHHNTVFNNIIADSLRMQTVQTTQTTKHIPSNKTTKRQIEAMDFVDNNATKHIDKVNNKFKIKAIIEAIGMDNYNFLNSYYKDKEANDYNNAKTCKKNRLVKQLKAKMQHIID